MNNHFIDTGDGIWRPLSDEEYDFWTRHNLPEGWCISGLVEIEAK